MRWCALDGAAQGVNVAAATAGHKDSACRFQSAGANEGSCFVANATQRHTSQKNTLAQRLLRIRLTRDDGL